MKAPWTREEAEFPAGSSIATRVGPGRSRRKKPHPPLPPGGETDYTPRRAAGEAGRDMAELSVSVFGMKRDPQAMEEYRQAGVAHALIGLPSRGRDDILRRLDEHAKLPA